MFIVVLFITAKNWKQINERGQTSETYHNSDESESQNQSQKVTYCMIPLILHSQEDNTIATKKRSVIAKVWGEEEVTVRDNMRKFFGGVELFCILIVVGGYRNLYTHKVQNSVDIRMILLCL